MDIGSVLADRFEIEMPLGSGGMGAIFRARDRMTGERVAVKIVHGNHKPVYDRFIREARLLAELSHPAIVKYVAHGPTPSGAPFLAMELLQGEDLQQRLKSKELSVEETLTMCVRVSDALAVAHARGIIHRDIKPPNVFLPDRDVSKAKLLDFGIAHFASGTRVSTRTGMVLGTPGFMAPEQARGEKTVDARADIFALGCVLYRCLAGTSPFPGTDLIAILAKLILEEPVPLARIRQDLPRELYELASQMLAKDPAQRPSNTAAITKTLKEIAHKIRETSISSDADRTGVVAITADEQRLMSVIVASPVVDVYDDTSPAQDAAHKRLVESIRIFGAEIATLANGSHVATLTTTGELVDRAAQAARCALAMRTALPNDEIVLATGRHFLEGWIPLGEVLDRAALMMRDALARNSSGGPRLGVRVDEVSAGLLDSRFEVGGDDLSLFLLREREPVEPAVRTLLGRATPCVGRERELSVLLATFAECVSEPTARPVLVTAAAGVGKSRLRYEFLRRLEVGEGAPLKVFMARGDPLGAGSPFRLLAQALRRDLGVLDGEALPVRRQKLRAKLSRHFLEPELSRVAEFLGELCGVPFPDEGSVQLRAARQDPMRMGDQMRRAFEDFVAAECAHASVLIVLDDLQWGDLPSVQLLDSTLRNLHERPLMVVALARPEIQDLFPQLWMERGLQQLHLGELSRKTSERFVREVLKENARPDLVAEIVDRAGGNAFFLEEMIRAVVDGRTDRLPDTVLAVVQARLDSLDPDARRILRAASTFGQAFWSGGIMALLGGTSTPSQADEWLDELQQREVITRRNESRFPGEREFTFRNAVVRDAAYAMFKEDDRVLAHRLAGEWLEKAGEPDAAALASHFEIGQAHSRAVSWYAKAAEQALEGNDFAAALARAKRGFALGALGEERGRLCLVQTEAHKWLGNNIDAKTAAGQALELLPAGSSAWLEALAVLATVSAKMGDHEQLLASANSVKSVPPKIAPAAYATAAARVAIQLLHTGHLDAADGLLKIAETVRSQVAADEPAMFACIYQARAIRSMFEGDVGAFTSLTKSAAKCFERAGDLRSAGTQRANVAYGYIELGAYAEAARSLREVLTTAERMGLKDLAAGARHNLGIALARQGELKEARTVEAAALKVALSQSNRRLECGCRTYLSTIHLLGADPIGAELEAKAALEILAVAPPMRAHAFGALSKALMAQGRAEEALEATKKALELMQAQTGVEEGESLVHAAHIECLIANGITSSIREALAIARDRLHARASRIADETWRDSFLHRVPDNARILELAHAWLDTAPS